MRSFRRVDRDGILSAQIAEAFVERPFVPPRESPLHSAEGAVVRHGRFHLFIKKKIFGRYFKLREATVARFHRLILSRVFPLGEALGKLSVFALSAMLR